MKHIKVSLLILCTFTIVLVQQAAAYSLNFNLIENSTEAWVLLADATDFTNYEDASASGGSATATVRINEDNWATGSVEIGTVSSSSSATAYYIHELDSSTTADYRLFNRLFSRGLWQVILTPDAGETGGMDFAVTYNEVGSPDRLWHLYDPLTTPNPDDVGLWLEGGSGPSFQPASVFLEYGVTYYLDSAYGFEGNSSLTFTGAGSPSPIPEPATILLLGLGVSGVLLRRKDKRRGGLK